MALTPHDVIEILNNPGEFSVRDVTEAMISAVKIIELVDDWQSLKRLSRTQPLDKEVELAEDGMLALFMAMVTQ